MSISGKASVHKRQNSTVRSLHNELFTVATAQQHTPQRIPQDSLLSESIPDRVLSNSLVCIQDNARYGLSLLRRLCCLLLPSFAVNFFTKHQGLEKRARSKQKIASLDGLRGIASLFVFHAHYSYSFSNCLEEAEADVLRTRIMYKPYISLLWSGIAMVDVFFVISGYVISTRPLRLVRSGDVSRAFSTISSAAFRRALRLYIPSMALIMVISLLTHLHVFDAGNAFFWRSHLGAIGPQEPPPPYVGSLFYQISDGFNDCYRMLDNTIPWGKFNFPYEAGEDGRPAGNTYDRHLWTIPVEFRCSMLIFMMLMSTARLRTPWRILIHVAFAVNCLLTERFPEFLFIGGMVFAEIDIIREEAVVQLHSEFSWEAQRAHDLNSNNDSPKVWRILQSASLLRHSFELTTCILGLFLLSIPSLDAYEYPAYRPVLLWVPLFIEGKHNVIRAVGAIMTTWPVARSPIIAPLFCNPVANYLGRISFSLYLVHGAIIRSLWYALQPTFLSLFTADLPVWAVPGYLFARLWLAGYVVVLPVVLWVADLFWRFIDQRAIVFAKWVEEKLSLA